MNIELEYIVSKFITLCLYLLKKVPGICYHSGNTNSDGAHYDYKNASGLGNYHWHHGMGPHLHPHIPSGAKSITIKIKGKDGSLHELKGFNYEGSSYTYNAVALLGFLGYVSASLVRNDNGDYIYEFQLSSSEADKGSIPVTEIDVEGHTRACIALRTLRDYGHSVEWDESSNTVFVDYEELGDDREIFNSMTEFKDRFGSTIAAFANKHGIEKRYLEAFIYCESTNGSGFYDDGRLLIRFENYTFVDLAGLSRDLVKSDSVSQEYYRIDTNSPWISIHDTQDTRYAALQWAIQLNEEAAYSSISMGFPQIMGFNYEAAGYNSAKEMYNNFLIGYTSQIGGFMNFLENDRGGAIVKALKSNDVREAISLYNGPGNVDKYLESFNDYMEQ